MLKLVCYDDEMVTVFDDENDELGELTWLELKQLVEETEEGVDGLSFIDDCIVTQCGDIIYC